MGALALLALIFASSAASAQSAPQALPYNTETRTVVDGANPPGFTKVERGVSTEKQTEWYGAPIILSDLAALSLSLAAASTVKSSSEFGVGLLVAGVGTYVLGGPIVHFSEDRIGTGFASLGLRLGAPLLGGAIGLGIGSSADSGCTGEGCGLGAVLLAAAGFGIGLLVAPIVDSAVLARKPVTHSKLSLSVTPTYQPATGETGLSVRGIW
jgi:hypothetical protein